MQIIILAAGKGSRMNSTLPKVMHEVAGIPMLERVVTNCSKITDNLILVYSSHLEPYLSTFKTRCKLVEQKEQLGTAHAVSVAKKLFNSDQPIGVIYGDNPLITPEIMNGLFQHLDETNSEIITLAFECNEPNQYGKIILDKSGDFKKIVESKFANEEEKKITLCNSGIMAFAPNILEKYIDQCLVVDNSTAKKELYLTDIIEIAASGGSKVAYFKSYNHHLVVGINTQNELENANSLMNKEKPVNDKN